MLPRLRKGVSWLAAILLVVLIGMKAAGLVGAPWFIVLAPIWLAVLVVPLLFLVCPGVWFLLLLALALLELGWQWAERTRAGV
jgi:hypothetical protein